MGRFGEAMLVQRRLHWVSTAMLSAEVGWSFLGRLKSRCNKDFGGLIHWFLQQNKIHGPKSRLNMANLLRFKELQRNCVSTMRTTFEYNTIFALQPCETAERESMNNCNEQHLLQTKCNKHTEFAASAMN